ncbi:MAG: hypothetical protein QF745_02215 [Planctomycetota bacterium]|nr:hypothetical protein [Planctomycetota bacterium]
MVLTHSWIILLLLGMFPRGGEMEPSLVGARGLAWNPNTGETAVLLKTGTSVAVFDAFLRFRKELPLEGEVKGIQQREGQWIPRETASPNSVSGPAGREIRIDPKEGILGMSLTPWESQPIITFGKGWACVSYRSAWVPPAPLVWEISGGERRVSMWESNVDDALQRQSFLRGLHPGATIKILRTVSAPQFPSPGLEEWVEFEIPEVSATGPWPQKTLTLTLK